jgi:hypothetical protein
MLEVDGKWGPFFRCNPLPFYNPTDGQHIDTKHWGCFPWHGRAPTPWINSQQSGSSCLDNAYCPALMNLSVGRDPAQHHAYVPGSRNLGTYFGGEWYSTTSQGQCKAGRSPGDGKEPSCSWRVAPGTATKTINATCMDSHLMPLVEANGKACFAALPQPIDRDSMGYVRCVDDAITGCGTPAANFTCNKKGGASIAIQPLERAPMIAAWEKAFADPADGGCPNVSGPNVS